MNGLRDYQQDLYLGTRRSLIKNRSACIQLATGGGKTPIMAAICESIYTKKKRAWIIVPRTELLIQMSRHLLRWNIPHGLIASGSQESRAYRIHVVSKDTLIRRYEKIKNWPDFLFFDEAHLYIDKQLEIVSHLDPTSKIIGMTATPERMDGRGLSEVYQELIEGPSIPWLTTNKYLTELKYFYPPLEGLNELKKVGVDLDAESLDDLLKRKKVYGEAVGHYEKYGKGKAALIFNRNIISAYQTAEIFRDKGFNFHCIEGKMSAKRRRDLIQALTLGNIDGLTNCDIATYGLDIPRVEYGACLRPTFSRSLYMQIIGRILRPFEDEVTGYKKKDAYFFDHVNLILEHQEENYPGVPLHYAPEIKWNFAGTEKRKRNKKEKNIMLCPNLPDVMYCDKPSCRGCEHNKEDKENVRQPMIVVPAELVEAAKPVAMSARPPAERREFQDRINKHVMDYKTEPAENPVRELLKIAEECGYAVVWVYYRLTNEDRITINIPLLHEIARIKGFKPGWVHFVKQKIKGEIKAKKQYEETMI